MSNKEPLIKLAASLMEPKQEFKIGDVVTWKEGLSNKRADGPFVVTAVLDQPVLDGTENPGSPYFREPLDIRVALIERDGDLSELYVDSRRLRLA